MPSIYLLNQIIAPLRARLTDVYSNAKAKDLVPGNQLLVAKLEDGFGWEQICPFLGQAIPDTPYPRGNAPAEFEALGKKILAPGIWKVGVLFMTSVAIPTASVAAWYYVKRG